MRLFVVFKVESNITNLTKPKYTKSQNFEIFPLDIKMVLQVNFSKILIIL